MGRKKDDMGGIAVVLAILLAIVWALAIAAGIVGPLIILVWWLICEAKWRHWSKLDSVSECLPSADAAEEIRSLRDQIANYQTMVALVRQTGEDERLPVRMDGTFDNRNRRGKELNQLIDQTSESLRLAHLQKEQKEMETSLAMARWVQCRTHLMAARAGAVVWLATFALINASQAELARDLGMALLKESPHAAPLGASVMATGSALIGLTLTYLIIKHFSFAHAAVVLANSRNIEA